MSHFGRDSGRATRVWSLITILGLALGVVFGSSWSGPDGANRIWQIASGAVDAGADRSDPTDGYYEDLLDAGERRRRDGWRIEPSPPSMGTVERLHETDAVIWDDPFQRFRLRPNADLTYKGAQIRINEDGLRDRPIPVDPAVRRVAMVGSSILMGSGVPVDEVFENRFEDRVNAGAFGRRARMASLNFGVPGYRIDQLADVVERRVADFNPSVVVLVVNDLALNANWSRHLVRLVTEGRELRYRYLREVVADAGVDAGMPVSEIVARLEPYRNRVLSGALRRVDEWCRERDVPLIFLVLDQPSDSDAFSRRLAEARPAIENFGRPILDLSDAFEAVDRPRTLWVEAWDRHPTSEGHALLAEALGEAIRSNDALADLLLGPELDSSFGASNAPQRP